MRRDLCFPWHLEKFNHKSKLPSRIKICIHITVQCWWYRCRRHINIFQNALWVHTWIVVPKNFLRSQLPQLFQDYSESDWLRSLQMLGRCHGETIAKTREGPWHVLTFDANWCLTLLSRTCRRQYSQEPYVIGYDLRNEPRGIPAATARNLQLSTRGKRVTAKKQAN